MASVNGGELLVKYLESEGIQKIFSIPGGQLVGVYESIRKSPNLELVVPRQEGASALMACGYSLAREKPSVVISTAGAGVIYELDGVKYAWQERIPLISIAPQVQSWRIKPIQENLQALDQDRLYEPVTKFNCILYHARRIPQLLARAFRIAVAPEPGPVHLDLPIDIAFQKVDLKPGEMKKLIPGPEKTRFSGKIGADPAEIQNAVSLIRKAQKPLALIGRGLASNGCSKSLSAFLEKTKMPGLRSSAAFSALSGKLGPDLGTIDCYDDDQLSSLVSESDLLLYLEPDREVADAARKITERLGPKPSIQFSSHAPLLHGFAPLSCALSGTPDMVLDQLEKGLGDPGQGPDKTWRQKLDSARDQAYGSARSKIPGHRLAALEHTFAAISGSLSKNDFVVCEGREIVHAAKLHLKNYSPGRAILVPADAPSGSGFPLALGIKAGAPEAKVFLVSERDSFKIHGRELQTSARYKFGVCSIVAPEQDLLCETEPQLARLAESLEVKGMALREPVEEINDSLLGRAFELESGMLLEIRGY